MGASTALRDAALPRQQIVTARDGRMALLAGVAAYEAEMREYAFDAVEKSLEQMDGRALVHKPVIGRAVTELSRAGMRVVNHLPPLKRRMAASLMSGHRMATNLVCHPERSRRISGFRITMPR